MNRRFWHGLLWMLIFPHRSSRAEPTLSGVMLMVLSFGLGMAAYNSANNILFITLSLLLASLILSGVLSWLNLRNTEFDLRVDMPLRAGEPARVEIIIRNNKGLLPTHGLSFDLAAEPVREGLPEPFRSSEMPRGPRARLRERLAQVDRDRSEGRLGLGAGLASGEERRLVWNWTPPRRGKWRLTLESVGSLFPFGFLHKYVAIGESREVIVWPTPVVYFRRSAPSHVAPSSGERVARLGSGDDLLALRKYEPGDSHRLIHWKASARQRHLLVRQYSAETEELCSLYFESDDNLWFEPEAFERAVSLASTLAEDLFRAGRLRQLSLDAEPSRRVRRVADIEAWLDSMALLTPRPRAGSATRGERRGSRDEIQFRPDGPRGAAAYVEGRKITSA